MTPNPSESFDEFNVINVDGLSQLDIDKSQMYKVEQYTNKDDSNDGSECVVMNINTFREQGLSSTKNMDNKEKITQPKSFNKY